MGSSLKQELNLARRACWQNKINKLNNIQINKEEYVNNNSNINNNNNNNLIIKSNYLLNAKKNGANCNLKQTEESYEIKKRKYCDPMSVSYLDKTILCQLYYNMFQFLVNIIAATYLNLVNVNSMIFKLFKMFKCYILDKLIFVFKYFQIKLIKLQTFNPNFLLLIVCLVLICADNVEGRPNQSSVVAGIVIDDSAGEGSESSHQISRPELAATYPGLDMNSISLLGSQSKRAAEVPQSTTAEVTLKSAEGHQVASLPVAQVEFDRVKTPFIIGLWILSASIAKIGFHMTPKLNKIFPESCLLIVVGVLIGVVLYFVIAVKVSPLTPNTFFFYMLPPIILDAGYFMPNRLFFDNLGTILLMAVVGTIFNIATIGASLWACGKIGFFSGPTLLEILLFTSVISAVDPVAVLAVFEEIHVNEILYIVVFGESLLNDAVTVVLYHMMEAYNEIGYQQLKVGDFASGVASFFVVAIGGTVIGVLWGFLTGLVTRYTDHVRVIEPIFIFVMAYLAYLNAEIFHMSGILAITFCGITMKNYVESNISQKSHTTVKYALKMLSSSAETIIFMFLGVATFNNSHSWDTWFVILTILFCSIFRILGVIILSAMANKFRLHKLSKVDQFVMSYGGLRGAVAFALVLLIDDSLESKPMFVTTTIAVIYFTVFVQGITIKPLVKFLNVKRANKRKPTMNERIHERFMDHLMAGIEDIVGKTGNYNVRDKFKRFDNRFIRPLLIRDLKGAEPKIIETYSKLTMRDAMEVMRRNPSTIGQMSGTESMSALFRNYTSSYLGGSPSLTNLETCSRNLDMHELDYNPSKKDLTDAKIHHLLAEELKPYRRHRRLSYSRHAVDDRDLSTQVNYKMHMNIRRMVNDRKHHKRSKRGNKQEGLKTNHVSFHDFQRNGSSKQISHEENQKYLSPGGQPSDDWDDGLTFTAKSSPDSDRVNNNSLIDHITSLPGFDTSKARIIKHYAPSSGGSPEKSLSPDVGPTAAELILPWRRDRSYQNFVGETAVIQEEERNLTRDSESERRVATPTALESQLPWKRNEDESEDGGAVQQNEFPAWASNKEYLAYNSPSATFLGGLSKPKQAKSVIGLFRRESSGSGSVITAGSGGGIVCIGVDVNGSDPLLANALLSSGPGGILQPPVPAVPITQFPNTRKPTDKRSASISGGSFDAHSGPFPVTASHRRNTRRGSMLELSGDTIPEENHPHSKSMSEHDEWNGSSLEGTTAQIGGSFTTGTTTTTTTPPSITRPIGFVGLEGIGTPPIGIGNKLRVNRESLLLPPKLTPKAQIRRMNQSHVTTALLATSESDDDEDEDFDVYDDDHIVNTCRNKI